MSWFKLLTRSVFQWSHGIARGSTLARLFHYPVYVVNLEFSCQSSDPSAEQETGIVKVMEKVDQTVDRSRVVAPRDGSLL